MFSYGGGRSDHARAHGNNVTSYSRARESIRSLVPSFVDLYTMGHERAASRVREEGVDILVDLQGHTLGGRNEIMAARPAPIQVNPWSHAATAIESAPSRLIIIVLCSGDTQVRSCPVPKIMEHLR